MSDEPAAPADNQDEFAGIPATPRAKSPLVAVVVVALAAVLVWHLRSDIAYAVAGRRPADLGDARSLVARGVTLDDNHYVTIAGQAERRYALYVEPKGERARQTLFRLLGGGTRLFVMAVDTAERTDLGERWTGRLRRFDALPFAASLRSYYGRETHAVRYLSLDALKAELAAGGGALTDRTGAPITVGADEEVVVDVDYPGELKVWLSKDKYPSLGDARHELDRLKLAPSAGEETKDEYLFIVSLPEARKNEIVGALSGLEVAFQPRQERYTVKRGELLLDGDTLVVGQAARAAWPRIAAVGVPTPITIGPDAFVVLEGEAPGDYWWAPLVAALLVAFAIFNVWYLVRSLRRRA